MLPLIASANAYAYDDMVDASNLDPEKMRSIKPMFENFKDDYGDLVFKRDGPFTRIVYNSTNSNKTQLSVDPVFNLAYDVRGL